MPCRALFLRVQQAFQEPEVMVGRLVWNSKDHFPCDSSRNSEPHFSTTCKVGSRGSFLRD